MPEARTVRLDRSAWISAATEAVAEGGVRAVAVEPLAARLGATKGSFYWHFRDRDDLVVAVLDRWQEESTTRTIELARSSPDPSQRLRALFDLVFRRSGGGPLEMALLAGADDPLVAPALARVTRCRIDYLTEVFHDLGAERTDARHRALLAYSAHIGLLTAHQVLGGRVFPAGGRQGYLEFLLPALEPPA